MCTTSAHSLDASFPTAGMTRPVMPTADHITQCLMAISSGVLSWAGSWPATCQVLSRRGAYRLLAAFMHDRWVKPA